MWRYRYRYRYSHFRNVLWVKSTPPPTKKWEVIPYLFFCVRVADSGSYIQQRFGPVNSQTCLLSAINYKILIQNIKYLGQQAPPPPPPLLRSKCPHVPSGINICETVLLHVGRAWQGKKLKEQDGNEKKNYWLLQSWHILQSKNVK